MSLHATFFIPPTPPRTLGCFLVIKEDLPEVWEGKRRWSIFKKTRHISGINLRVQRIFLRLICGKQVISPPLTGTFGKEKKKTAKLITETRGFPGRPYSISITLTFKMIGDVKQSRLLGVNERILGFKTTDCGKRFGESSGHTLLHVTQHGKSTYK